MKESSKTKPRLVVYVTTDELKACKARSRAIGLRTPSQWIGTLMRRELLKPPQ